MNKDHIELALAKIRSVFEKTSQRIEALAPPLSATQAGEKIPATRLANEIADEIGMTGPALYPTLKFLFEDYPGVKISRGAHGGIEKVWVEPESSSEDPQA